jgi:tetratricopeptide (TPR) repeat protein
MWFQLGKVAQRLRWAGKAEILYRQALQYDTDVEAWANLAEMMDAQGKIQDAEEAYRTVTILDPENGHAWTRLGRILEQTGRVEEAKIALKTGFQHDPQKAREYFNEWSHGRIKILQDEAEYQRRVSQDEFDVEAWLGIGYINYTRGKFPDAESAFRSGLKIDPNNCELLNMLGCTQMHLRRIANAESNFQHALEVDQDYFYCHYNLGLILKDNGRFNPAIDHFYRCTEIFPGDSRPWVHLGLLLKKVNKWEESKHVIDVALRMDPWLTYVFPILDQIYFELKEWKDPSHLYT